MEDDKGGHNYEIYTTWEHLVAQYTGLNILQVEELDYLDYLIYRRDAFIDRMSQSEEGTKYLDKAWRLEQTAPDRDSLRAKFGKEV